MLKEKDLQAPHLRKCRDPGDLQLAGCLVPGPGTRSCQESGRPRPAVSSSEDLLIGGSREQGAVAPWAPQISASPSELDSGLKQTQQAPWHRRWVANVSAEGRVLIRSGASACLEGSRMPAGRGLRGQFHLGPQARHSWPACQPPLASVQRSGSHILPVQTLHTPGRPHTSTWLTCVPKGCFFLAWPL